MRGDSSNRYGYTEHDLRESKLVHRIYSYDKNFSGVTFESTAFIGAASS